MTELKTLELIEDELERFRVRLKELKNKIHKDGSTDMNKKQYIYSCREAGALKRAALDLKQCLTKNL